MREDVEDEECTARPSWQLAGETHSREHHKRSTATDVFVTEHVFSYLQMVIDTRQRSTETSDRMFVSYLCMN